MMTTYEAFIRDARAAANSDSTRVRAVFDAMYECCKQQTGVPGPPEAVVDAALLTVPLSSVNKDKVRELCTWALHVAPLEPPMSPADALALAYRCKRLQTIWRIIQPAPAESRLNFLESRHGSIRDRRPLDMLEDDRDFAQLRHFATAWAEGWSRTAVTIYEGKHEIEPNNLEPLYTAVEETDPQRPLWKRASEALDDPGYEWPLGPYPDVGSFTLFVTRQTAGYTATAEPEACVQISVDGEHIQFRLIAADTALEPQTVQTDEKTSFIDLAKRVIAQLR